MSKLKRRRQSRSFEDKNISTTTSAFIETPSTTENQLNNLKDQLIDWQEPINGFHHENSRFIQEHVNNKNKQTDVNTTQNDNEDNWVCPVAVALRRAGYNVPLRPSKSWLERDRKKQALLRKRLKDV